MSKVPPNGPTPTHSKTAGKSDKSDNKTTDDGYKNLEGKRSSYPKASLPQLTNRQEKLKNQKPSSFTRTRTIRKKKHKNGALDNDEDEFNRNNNNQPTDEEKKLVKDNNLTGGGFSRHDNKKFQDVEDEDELDLDDLEETDQQSDQREKNKENVQEFFRKFLEASHIEHSQKKQLEKMLFSMLKQCVAGLEAFAPEDPRHISLGKSANICKHALSALARDNFIEAKKLVKLITPKK